VAADRSKVQTTIKQRSKVKQTKQSKAKAVQVLHDIHCKSSYIPNEVQVMHVSSYRVVQVDRIQREASYLFQVQVNHANSLVEGIKYSYIDIFSE
jgi:hypothetical protein